MHKCTLRYVWMGTSYKSELTITNTAAFLPMIRHLNKCSWCVCWNMRSHREERLAVTWGCQRGVKNIRKTKGTEIQPDSTWKLETKGTSLKARLSSASSAISTPHGISCEWPIHRHLSWMYGALPSKRPLALRAQRRCHVLIIKASSSSPTARVLKMTINRNIWTVVVTGYSLCECDLGPSEIFMSHLKLHDTKVNAHIVPVGPEAGSS